MSLRITVEESEATMTVKLEGRVAGPYTAELDRIWELASPTLASRRLILDLRETTYADAGGIRALRAIYSQTKATILVGTPWTQYLAEEVSRRKPEPIEREARNADRA
jgi:anti-anti-sigma regulatory factor